MRDKEGLHMPDEHGINGQAEKTQVIQTSDALGGFRYAGFWMRFWAYMVDIIIVFSINGILLKLLALINGSNISISIWPLGGIISAIVFYIYFLLMTKNYG